MTKLIFILIPALLTLIGCASSKNKTVFMWGSRYPQFLMIYTSASSDTVLVVSQGNYSDTKYSYHTTQKTDTGLVLSNLNKVSPEIELLNNREDEQFSFDFVDQDGVVLNNIDIKIEINDTVKCSLSNYDQTLNFTNKIDSVYSIKLAYGEKVIFTGNNLFSGEFKFEISGIRSNYFDNRILYDDYFIPSSAQLSLTDSTKLRATSIYSGHQEYKFNSIDDLKNRSFKRELKDLNIKWLE